MTVNLLPIAAVVDGSDVVARFYGPNAVEWAEEFTGKLPDADDGHLSIDVSDDECPNCHATFSREAWTQDGEYWLCPKCGESDPRDREDN